MACKLKLLYPEIFVKSVPSPIHGIEKESRQNQECSCRKYMFCFKAFGGRCIAYVGRLGGDDGYEFMNWIYNDPCRLNSMKASLSPALLQKIQANWWWLCLNFYFAHHFLISVQRPSKI